MHGEVDVRAHQVTHAPLRAAHGRRGANDLRQQIGHDLGVVANVADRVAVIYCGQIGECGPVERIYRSPAHPYTRALLACVPDAARPGEPLATIPGQLPAPADELAACRFAPRCALADEGCRHIGPPPVAVTGEHEAFCHHPRIEAEP